MVTFPKDWLTYDEASRVTAAMRAEVLDWLAKRRRAADEARLQSQIDEEGCGAFFAAAREPMWRRPECA